MSYIRSGIGCSHTFHVECSAQRLAIKFGVLSAGVCTSSLHHPSGEPSRRSARRGAFASRSPWVTFPTSAPRCVECSGTPQPSTRRSTRRC